MKRTRCPHCDGNVTCKNKENIQKALDRHIEVCSKRLEIEELMRGV